VSLPVEFVRKYRPLGLGQFGEHRIDDLDRRDLIAIIGWMQEQLKATMKQHHHDLDVICGRR